MTFPQSFSALDDAPSTSVDDFGPLQSSSDASTPLTFTSADFAAALSPSTLFAPHFSHPQRSFTDSFAPALSSEPSPPSFRPAPPNGELLDSFGSSGLDDFSFNADLDREGFSRLVDDNEDEDEAGFGGAVDLTSTLMSLRGLREELGRVKDEDERRELAGMMVEGLFGGLLEEEGSDEEEQDNKEEGGTREGI